MSTHIQHDSTHQNHHDNQLAAFVTMCNTLTNILQDVIIIVSKDGILQYVNAYAAHLVRHKPEELIGRNIRELVGNYSDRFAFNLQGMIRAKKTQRFTEKFVFDEKELWFDTILTPIRDKTKMIKSALIICHDVSSGKRKETSLLQNEYFLRQILQQMPFPTVVVNRQRGTVFMSQSFLSAFNIPAASLTEDFVYTITKDPMMKSLGLEEHLLKVYDGNLVYIPQVCIALDRIGSRLKVYRKDLAYYEITIFPVYFENEEVRYAVIVWRDVTEQAQTFQTLEKSELKYRTLFYEAADPIIVCDTLGNLLEMNKKAQQIFSHDKKEIAQMNFTHFHPHEERKKLIRAFKRGIFERTIHAHGLKAIDKSGNIFEVDLSGNIIEYNGQEVFYIVLRDISEIKKKEHSIISLIRKLRQQIRFLKNKLPPGAQLL